MSTSQISQPTFEVLFLTIIKYPELILVKNDWKRARVLKFQPIRVRMQPLPLIQKRDIVDIMID